MTISTIVVIKNRVESATPASPIAVFKDEQRGKTVLNAVFANTRETAIWISEGVPELVGVYDNTMPRSQMVAELRAALDS